MRGCSAAQFCTDSARLMTRSGGDSQGTFHQAPNRKKYCNSILAPKELGLYYLQSRYYDPELCRFLNADAYVSTGQGELGNNMFAYCNNNPVCMADFLGEDAIYVVDFTPGRGLRVFGHALLFVQDEYGNWHKTEFTGIFPDKSTAVVCTVGVDEEDIRTFLSSGTTRYVYIAGDFSASYKLANDYNQSNYGGYDFLMRNCLHYVKEILRAGNPEQLSDWMSFSSADIIPAVFYSTLLNNRAQSIQQSLLYSVVKRRTPICRQEQTSIGCSSIFALQYWP